MSSGGYGRYESAEARDARLLREALLGWQVACAERDSLAMRAKQESSVRGSIGVAISRPDRNNANDRTASEIATLTAALREETKTLAQQVNEGIESRSRRNAEDYIARSELPEIPRVAEAARKAGVAAAAPQGAAPNDLDSARLDEAIRAEVVRAVVEGIDVDTFREFIDAIRRGPTQAHALFAVGRLREVVDTAITEQARASRRREELEAELNRASAAFMLAPGNPDLPTTELEQARESLSRGEPVADHVIQRISAAANRLEDQALAALRALNTRTSSAILFDAFAARGYHPIELAQVLVVEAGQLVARDAEQLLGRDDEPNHAIRVRVRDGGEMEVQEVRIAAGSGQDQKSDDRRFEQKMCAAVEDVQEYVRKQGMVLDISLGNVSIPTVSTAGKAKKSSTVTAVIDERHQESKQHGRAR